MILPISFILYLKWRNIISTLFWDWNQKYELCRCCISSFWPLNNIIILSNLLPHQNVIKAHTSHVNDIINLFVITVIFRYKTINMKQHEILVKHLIFLMTWLLGYSTIYGTPPKEDMRILQIWLLFHWESPLYPIPLSPRVILLSFWSEWYKDIWNSKIIA